MTKPPRYAVLYQWPPGSEPKVHYTCSRLDTRLAREVLLTEMAQLYEEVAGKGFYRWNEGAEQRGGLYDL